MIKNDFKRFPGIWSLLLVLALCPGKRSGPGSVGSCQFAEASR